MKLNYFQADKFKVMLQKIGADWFPVVPGAHKDLLAGKLTLINIHRMRIIAWLLMAFNLILIVIQLVYTKRVDLPGALEAAPYLIIIRVIIIGVSVIFLFIAGRPTAVEVITRRHYICESGFILLNLVGFAVLSGLIQSLGPGIASSYLMAVLISASFFYISWPKGIIIFTVAWAVMSIMVWSFQYDWVVAFSAFLNGSFVTIMAIFLSRVIYVTRVREYFSQRMIELQQEKLAHSNNILKRLSYMDFLTDIPNRRFFDEFIAREWKRALREQEMLSLIMVDIDQFKMYNDTFGHQAGDDILLQVATALGSTVKRPGDLIARYGGEEFAVVLPKTALPGARQLSEHMRQAVEGLNISHPSSPGSRLTISLGLATMQPGGEDLLGDFINAADKALYEAKEAGGNCVFS